jgi:malonyl-CoA O-methyltransferase
MGLVAYFNKMLFHKERTLIQRFHDSLCWLKLATLPNSGVKVTGQRTNPYPEVTGYLIPTLLHFGERELAIQYGQWLVNIQHADGYWTDPDFGSPFTFDTGQILKGLIALSSLTPEFNNSIKRGCDWLVDQIQEDGAVTTPDYRQWELPGGRRVPEAIHLYVLEPLRMYGGGIYNSAVDRALQHYLAIPELTSFSTLNHFHAYIVEALVDLGLTDRAEDAMKDIASYLRYDGFLPAYCDESWICSTGMFQYAVIWYKLGNRQLGDRVFAYGCKFQEASGGFLGSYGKGGSYFPSEEIPWAVKYFMDAVYWKIRSSFDSTTEEYPASVSQLDGRWQLVSSVMRNSGATVVGDIGCGKGRFARCFLHEFPDSSLYGVDLSPNMLSALPPAVIPLKGTMLQIPVADNFFDFVYCVESLEHAVNIPAAIRELARVIRRGGHLLIIDKNAACRGALEIEDWEQWFLADEVTELLAKAGFSVRIHKQVPYDDSDGRDGLFFGWEALKEI